MLILTETTDNLQVVLGGAVTANQLPCVSSWRDITASAFTPGRTVVNTNSTTDVNIVPAPGGTTQRVIDSINICNCDTAAAPVTIKFDANGTEYIIWQGTLQVRDVLQYADGVGFFVKPFYQPLQLVTVQADAGANFAMTNATQAERFAGNSTRHLFIIDLVGYTQVRMTVNKMVGSASVNTPIFRAKYYTSYNVTVGNFLQLGADAQIEVSMVAAAYADTGWLAMAAGAAITGCCIGFTELGGDAGADPAIGFTQIMFR